MGFWNKVGRWLAWAVGLLFAIIGFNALWHGLDIIQVERGWTGVIAGTVAMSAGVLIILLTVLIDRIDALRHAVMTQRAVRFVDPAPFRMAEPEPEPEPAVDLNAPEPPKPIEVPVEPRVAPAAAAPAAFEFQSFMRRPMPEEEPRVEPVPEPEQPAREPELESPPEQIRRFAPPQFRRPTVVQPPPAAEELAPTQPEVEAEFEPAAPPAPEPEPVEAAQPPVEIEVTQTTISVEASITEAIVEELRLPRASNLQSAAQAAPETPESAPMATEPEPVAEAAAEPEPEILSEPEPQPEPETPPLREPVAPPREVARTHVWLEKALNDDGEPALDWLRQRRGREGPQERNVPSFMRRHVSTEAGSVEAPAPPQAPEPQPEPQIVERAVEPQPARASGTPGVVGRYAANGSDYTLYADGSIDAQTPDGPRHFVSMDELRGFLQQQNEATAG